METPLSEVFKHNLTNYLKSNGISQKRLAGLMKVVPQALNKYIKGQRKPGIETIENVATALNLHPCELLVEDKNIPTLISKFINKNKIDSNTFEKLFFSINDIKDSEELITEVNKFGGWRYLLDYIKEENLIREKSQTEYNKVKYKIIKSMQDTGFET
ncbi:helix-turn-helix transcriptional regulator [bacterium]|nr:helix-turn-helix transcriptional regulator [bacterium]